ncbi:MAG: hypothetical protein JWO46_91 [Nocardioidaceae bacterium]|nr:hypothetical protein [Nocardioidaceae bacterium]
MSVSFWQSVASGGLHVPSSRSLDDMTAELGDMLGSTDPVVRTEIAHPILSAWIARGYYDHLLARLANGLLSLVEEGVGGDEDDLVFQRSWAAAVMAEVVERDNRTQSVDGRTLLSWGDKVATWMLDERDLRDFVPGKGQAQALVHGADVLAALARSSRIKAPGLVLLVEVVAARLLEPTTPFLVAGEPDRLARTTMEALRRELLTLDDLEPFLDSLSRHASPDPDPVTVEHPYRVSANVQAFLRALHLQVLLSPDRPGLRSDLLLTLTERLQASNAAYLRPGTGPVEPEPIVSGEVDEVEPDAASYDESSESMDDRL